MMAPLPADLGLLLRKHKVRRTLPKLDPKTRVRTAGQLAALTGYSSQVASAICREHGVAWWSASDDEIRAVIAAYARARTAANDARRSSRLDEARGSR